VSFLLDPEKVRALAKPGHVRCHGNGIYGYTKAGAIVCRCVWRALEKQGVNLKNAKAVREAIGKEMVVAPPEKVEPAQEVVV
jgi:hypothetical protein